MRKKSTKGSFGNSSDWGKKGKVGGALLQLQLGEGWSKRGFVGQVSLKGGRGRGNLCWRTGGKRGGKKRKKKNSSGSLQIPLGRGKRTGASVFHIGGKRNETHGPGGGSGVVYLSGEGAKAGGGGFP